MSPQKELKEKFVSDLTGGSITEIYTVTSVALAGLLAHTVVKRWAAPNTVLSSFPLSFAVEFFFDVMLQLQAITLLSSAPSRIYACVFIIVLMVFLYRGVVSKGTGNRKGHTKQSPQRQLLAKIPFITAYRAQMLIITNMAILAVDFHAFPRRFAKVETWGTSMMDLGVGSFVFSMGLANSRSIIKKAILPAQKKQSYLQLLGSNTVKALPILALGVIRLISVKSLDYQEHVSEYGVHWNFFMTLGLLPIVLGLVDPVFAFVPRFFVALTIGILYEVALNQLSLATVILDESNRQMNLFTLNKEGLCSFAGYLSIFIFGQSFGSFVLTTRKTPNNLLGMNFGRYPKSWLTVSPTRGLVTMSVISLLMFAAAKDSLYTGNISRRLANLPYVLWVVSYNAVMLTGYNLIERIFGVLESEIFEAVNKNGLAIFLVANLMTGLVNMTVNTLNVSDVSAYAVLLFYSFAWVSLAIILDRFSIYIKL